jgi:crotonobetainyl-CoA:carnitine CoA-transferase CaiB-like acyl-CoA transferase
VSEAAAEADRPPLDGVVVADFSRVLAGPLATMFLADLGATVIKVERPGSGDDTRAWGPPFVGDLSTYFTSVNRNKRSITLDLTDADDLAVAHRLADRADVMVENFRPGALRAFALDDRAARARNPGLIYCSISGFGAGAGAELAGYDFVVQAVGGLMSVTGAPDGPPTKVGVALVDVLAGLHATIAIQAALRERDRTGAGQTVEINLLSSLLSSLVNQGAGYLNGGGVPTRMGNQHPSIAPYETLSTADGPLAVAVGNDGQFQRFTAAIGHAELGFDERFATNPARVGHRVELVAALENALSADTSANWVTRLRAVGVPCGPVHDIAGAVALATSLGLEPIARTDPIATDPIRTDPIRTMSSPLRFSRTPVRYDRPPPRLGADSTEVRAWLIDDLPLA